MTWKIGLVTLLVGILLVIGSFLFFGTSISRAIAEREVANLELELGSKQMLRLVSVDPGMAVKLRVIALLQLPETITDKAGERGKILHFTIPVNYEVYDESDNTVHLGAGSLSGSTILPAKNSPHLDSFDKEVKCIHDSIKFSPPESGKLRIEIELPRADKKDNPVKYANVKVYDRVHKTAGKWALGGFLSMTFGGMLSFVGFIVLIIGIIIAVAGKSEKLEHNTKLNQ